MTFHIYHNSHGGGSVMQVKYVVGRFGNCLFLNTEINPLLQPNAKQFTFPTITLRSSEGWELGVYNRLWVGARVKENRTRQGRGYVETGKPLVHKNKQTRGQAAVIKSSLCLVTHRNAAERQTALSSLTRRWPRPGAGLYPCSVQQCAFTQKPFLFPPRLARTGWWVFWIDSPQHGGEEGPPPLGQ